MADRDDKRLGPEGQVGSGKAIRCWCYTCGTLSRFLIEQCALQTFSSSVLAILLPGSLGTLAK